MGKNWRFGGGKGGFERPVDRDGNALVLTPTSTLRPTGRFHRYLFLLVGFLWGVGLQGVRSYGPRGQGIFTFPRSTRRTSIWNRSLSSCREAGLSDIIPRNVPRCPVCVFSPARQRISGVRIAVYPDSTTRREGIRRNSFLDDLRWVYYLVCVKVPVG